jgi:Ca2+-transporting ATPase
MKKPPRKTGESLFADGIGLHIMWVGLLMAGVTLGAQAWTIEKGYDHWQTIVFTILAFSQLGHVLAIRSERQFLAQQGLFSNLPLMGAVAITVLLQLAVIYLPVGNRFFRTQPLSLVELMACIGVSAIVFHAVEFEKFVKKLMHGR